MEMGKVLKWCFGESFVSRRVHDFLAPGALYNGQTDFLLCILNEEFKKLIFIPESFNTEISHQLFDNTLTFVNSQHWNTNSKGDFVLINRF